jgi:hypothetical protein
LLDRLRVSHPFVTRALRMPRRRTAAHASIFPLGSLRLNKGMMVMVGCVVGAGVLFYTSTGSSAARPTGASPTPRPERTAEVAHSGKTVTPAQPGTTPAPSATPAQARLTLAQVRNLPRPFTPPVLAGGGPQPSGPAQPATQPDATETPAPAETPAASTPPPGGPPSEGPPPPAVPTASAPPTTTPSVPWWALPTPPPLPPYPDAGVAPKPPSE